MEGQRGRLKACCPSMEFDARLETKEIAWADTECWSKSRERWADPIG